NIEFQTIELGKVKLVANLSPELKAMLDAELKSIELELINDKKKIIVERIKTLIIELFHSPEEMYQNLSVYLSKHLEYDYNYISNIFSEEEGNTIERFYIENRIERVKEMMVYESLNVTQIAYRLNFSSTSHLCQQFRKVTGIAPSKFKKLCETEDFVWRKV
ncbi:MAG: helix-turn-helix domain-containing protein, partial [Flavisolibacter sp.]